jgi:[ribosomal protein S18]-alanine N-acetyltransferase
MIKLMTDSQKELVIILEKELHLASCIDFPQAKTYVFEKETNVLGFITWIQHDNEVELLNFGVNPTQHGLGIGSQILKEWFDILAVSNIRHIFVEVRESNVIAIHLYTKYGFKLNRTRINYYQNPVESALEMRFDYE